VRKQSTPPNTACVQCGAPFYARPYLLRDGSRRYCSPRCWGAAKRKHQARPCAVCAAIFIPARAGSRYCSQACHGKAAQRHAPQACERCGSIFLPREPGRRYCGPACAVEARRGHRAPETRVCARCGAAFTVATHSDPRTLCSRACQSQAHGDFMRHDHPVYTCQECGTVFTRRPRSTEGARKAAYCSGVCALAGQRRSIGPLNAHWIERVTIRCAICGTAMLVRPSQLPRKRTCSRRCGSAFRTYTQPRVSSLERKMSAAFRHVGVRPQAQYLVGYFVVDFAFPRQRLVVEVDGSYWHRLPDTVARDRRESTYLANHGWRLVRLAEPDILASPADCAARVVAMLHDRSTA
jgi:very-short-patch-repair endonuclease/ribosomal protein S27AE